MPPSSSRLGPAIDGVLTCADALEGRADSTDPNAAAAANRCQRPRGDPALCLPALAPSPIIEALICPAAVVAPPLFWFGFA